MAKNFTPIRLLQSELRQFETDFAYYEVVLSNKTIAEKKKIYFQKERAEAKKKVKQFTAAITKLSRK